MLLVLTLTAAAPAAAATRTWDAGGANANWTTAANWQGNVAPVAGDTLVFPAGVVELPTTNDFPDGTEFVSLTFGKSYVLDGNRLLLADGITNTSTQTVVIALDITLKGTLIGSNSISIDVAAGGHVRLDGVINGALSAVLHKVGPGRLLLTGANVYNGATHVDAGVLQIEHVNALGSTLGQTIVQNGGTLASSVAAGVVAEPLTLTGEGTSSATDGAITALDTLYLTGTISLSAVASIYVDTGVTLQILGIVNGSGGLMKDGPGTLDYDGVVANVYLGMTTVRAGTLQLSRIGAVAIPAGLIVGDSNGAIWGDVVHLTRNEQIVGPVTVTRTGHLDIDTHVEVIDSLTMTGGKITSTGPGQIGLGGDVTVTPEPTAVASILGQLSLGAAPRTFAIGGTTLGLDIVAVVSGAPLASLIKTGPGSLRLRNGNVYQGLTTVQEGRLIVADSQALGTSSAGTMVMPEGTLDLLFSVAAEPLVAQDDGNGQSVTCQAAAPLTWGGPISIGGTVGFFVPSGCGLRLDGTISGPGNLSARPFGVGFVELAAINTYTGSTTMDTGGELRLGISNAIPDGSVVTLNGTFNLAGHSDAVAGLNASANSLVMLGDGTLTLAPPQNVPTNCQAVISGTGHVMKIGAGLARLAALNTYTGPTTVTAGVLLLDGRLSGPVTITGGTLAGEGIINGVVTATGGRVSPSLGNAAAAGAGTGTLITSPITLNAGVTLKIDIDGQTAGTQHDVLQGSGVTLNGPTLEIVASPNLQVSNLGEIVILRNILNNAIAGTFAGLAEGATIASNGKTFRLSYQGGDGNDVSLVPASRDYYLSEGATGTFFDLDILVANPTAAPAPVTFRFLLPDGGTHVQHATVGAFARLTLNVDSIAGLTDTAVSTVVTSDTGVPLIVERTMRWDASGYGAHTEKAAGGTSPTWYFAEGSQGFFSTYLLLVNPQSTDITATVVFLREGSTPVSRSYPVKAKSRVTVDAGADPDLVGSSFGMEVTFDAPGVAERAMYFGTDPLWKGGHESTGATAPSANWFLAEGATGAFFETFVLIANPGNTPATGTITYLPSTGVPVNKPFTVPAAGRLTINIEGEDPSLANAAVATQVTANHPVIVERAQYWPDPAPQWYEAHNSFGVTDLGLKWGLAEGRVGGPAGYQTYLLLANPGDTLAQVTLTFLRENGAPFDKTFNVPAKSRFTVDTGPATLVPELIDERFGALIVSNQPIAVERAMYSNANNQLWSAGTNATATALP